MRFLKRTLFLYLTFFLLWSGYDIFPFIQGGNVVLVKGFLEGWTFGGLKENMDICAWIEMWFSLS